MKRLIVFDFDGVIADSETLANTVLAEILTELGAPMTSDTALQTFMGKRFDEVIAALSATIGRPVEECVAVDIEKRTRERFRNDELKEIAGVRTYLDAFAGVKRCIASSSSQDQLAASHIRSGHEERLRKAGAHHVAHTYDEVEHITRQLFA